MIKIKINFRRTDKYNALNRWTDFCEKWSCVKYLMFFQGENRFFHVRCWLLLFSRVERVSKQFHLPFRRVKNAKEPSNFKQIFTTSWNWSLKIHFMGGKHRTFLYFNLEVFGDLMHLVKLYSCKYIIWRVLTDNVIGKPDTLSLNMPLDILSLERASYAWYSLAA